MNAKSNKARIKRANQIKAAKAMPTAILLEKKAKCDARALSIVEKLIEPQVDIKWMLDNLQHINRSHLEDIAEERAITKICGYVLCDNPLEKVVNKKYSISVLRNKIYDVEVMKNYCCFTCYNAMNYIMVQMLTGPLWLRCYEEIPKFKIKVNNDNKRDVAIPGIEINITGIQLTDDDLPKKKFRVHKKECQSDEELERNEMIDDEELEKDDDDDHHHHYHHHNDGNENHDEEDNDKKLEKDVEQFSKGLDVNDKKMKENIENLTNKLKKIVKVKDEIEEKNKNLTTKSIQTSSKIIKKEKINDSDSKTLIKKEKQKIQVAFTESLPERFENNFRELVTANTIKFLLGEKTEKVNILKGIRNQDKYARLCERLDKLDLDLEEPETSTPINLKPLPHFEVLKEQADDLVIKVNAFFKGKLEVEMPTSVKEDKKSEELETVIPLTDAHAPNALRKRLFLEKLDKVVPDLLPTLSCPGGIEYDYTIERITSVKSIVSTFNLTAKNIVFKTAEWTVVGLLMIKMLAFIDDLIKSLLSTKHAVSRISLILMSYNLEPDYLDTLIKSLIIESNKK